MTAEEAKKLCQNTVTNRLIEENKIQIDDFVGYTHGLQAVLQHKDYTISNLQMFEKICVKALQIVVIVKFHWYYII